ncbi:MAG: hypothetical protein WKG07_26565 [Hymenobacter sp.]
MAARRSDFPARNFPPEKTIYLSLLKETGMHRKLGGEYTLTAPTDPSFLPLWDASEDFLARFSRRRSPAIRQLMDELTAKLLQAQTGGWPISGCRCFCSSSATNSRCTASKRRYLPDLNAEVVDLFTKGHWPCTR